MTGITRTCLRYDEKIKILNLLDELPQNIPKNKLAELVSQKIEKTISPTSITRLLEKRAEIVSNSGDTVGCRLKPYLDQKFENELILEITKLPEDTYINLSVVQNLAARLKTKPEYENALKKGITFRKTWWSNFRKRHGWSVGRPLKVGDSEIVQCNYSEIVSERIPQNVNIRSM